MDDAQKSKLKQMLVDDEGYRQFPYKDTVGKLTIGVGRNLEDRGISQDEAMYMLNEDIKYFEKFLKENLAFYNKLTENRQNVLVNMCFNLGTQGFMKFKKMLQHLNYGRYEQAADEMLDSKWVMQVPNRAKRLHDLMIKG